MSRSAVIAFVLLGSAVVALGFFIARADTRAAPTSSPATAEETSTTATPESATTTSTTTDPTTTDPATTTSTAPVTPTATMPPPTTLAPGTSVCDPYLHVVETGTVAAADLVEISGTAVGREAPDVVWAHNDSGDGPVLYAIGPGGEDLGSVSIRNAFAFDWEDMAAAPGEPGRPTQLYLGDIGDNLGIRGGRITVYRIDEPLPDDQAVEADVLDLVYPDQESPNAEALFVDPVDRSLYIVTRNPEVARVYRADAAAAASSRQDLQLVVALPLGASVTAADITWDGSVIAFRGESSVWMWHRENGSSIAQTLEDRPCSAPSPDEIQGESIAFAADGSYVAISEGSHPPIHTVARDQSS